MDKPTQRQAINKIKGEYTPTKENLSQEGLTPKKDGK